MRIKDMVEQTLRDVPATRNSDKMLLIAVYRHLGVDVTRSFASVISDNTLPSFETIRRTRQKLQEQHPELAPSDRIKKERQIKQQEFLGFAKTGQGEFIGV